MMKKPLSLMLFAFLLPVTPGFAQESPRSTIEKARRIQEFRDNGGEIAAVLTAFTVVFQQSGGLFRVASVTIDEAVNAVLQGEIAAKIGNCAPKDITIKNWNFKDTGTGDLPKIIEASYTRKTYGLPGPISEGPVNSTLLHSSAVNRLSAKAGLFRRVGTGSYVLATVTIAVAVFELIRAVRAVLGEEAPEVGIEDVRQERLRAFFASDLRSEAAAVLAADPDVSDAVNWTYAVLETGMAKFDGTTP